MPSTREHFREIIFSDFQVGLTQQQCYNRLRSKLSDKAPSKVTVYKWYNEFKRGRCSIKDQRHEGRPNSAVLPVTIDAVRRLINEDCHISYDEIQACLGIGRSSIHKIIREHLEMRKLYMFWIPCTLKPSEKECRVKWSTEMLEKFDKGASKSVYNIVTLGEMWIYAYKDEVNHQSTVWVFQNDPNETKMARSRSIAKRMIVCCFSKTGLVTTVTLDDPKTITSEWYTTHCLPEVLSQLAKHDKNRQIILHYNNTTSHTTQFSTLQDIELIGHPSHSPDLIPNDFFLIPKIKDKLRGERFSSPDEAIEAFKNHVLSIPTSFWQNCFGNWFHRMQRCIDAQGEYYETNKM